MKGIDKIAVLVFLLLSGVCVCCSDESGGPARDGGGAKDDAAADGWLEGDAGEEADGGDPGGDGGVFECQAVVGSGSVVGSVEGRTFEANHAGGIELHVLGLVGYSVGFSSGSGTCAQLAQTALDLEVTVMLCTNEPGEYPVGSNCLEGPGVSIENNVKIALQGQDVSADSGTIVVESFDPSCGGSVRGSFVAVFGADTLTGSFDTVGCGVYEP